MAFNMIGGVVAMELAANEGISVQRQPFYLLLGAMLGSSPVGLGVTLALANQEAEQNQEAQQTLAPLGIITTSLPSGLYGTPYSVTVTATGGTPPYTWNVDGLPSGLHNIAGVISGSPMGTGSFNVTIQVVDSSGNATTPMVLSLSVGVMPLSITTPISLPNGTVNSAYPTSALASTGFPLTAIGGIQPYIWSEPDGILNSLGLILSPSGSITGQPNADAANTYSIKIQVTDNEGNSTWQSFTLTVAQPATESAMTRAVPNARGRQIRH
jgi:hypothetical protein